MGWISNRLDLSLWIQLFSGALHLHIIWETISLREITNVLWRLTAGWLWERLDCLRLKRQGGRMTCGVAVFAAEPGTFGFTLGKHWFGCCRDTCQNSHPYQTKTTCAGKFHSKPFPEQTSNETTSKDRTDGLTQHMARRLTSGSRAIDVPDRVRWPVFGILLVFVAGFPHGRTCLRSHKSYSGIGLRRSWVPWYPFWKKKTWNGVKS